MGSGGRSGLAGWGGKEVVVGFGGGDRRSGRRFWRGG